MKKLLFLLVLGFGLANAQNNLIILSSTFGTTAASDTLTTSWFSVSAFQDVEIGLSYTDSLLAKVVVNYYGGSSSTYTISTTADTLGASTAAGEFEGKVLRHGTTNLIPGAAMIRVNVYAISGNALTGTLRINLIRK